MWDTAQAVYALGEAGVPRNDPRMIKAADWMLSKEVRHKGDWAVKVPNTEPGGWYFEFNNEFYPDTDDTAQVLLALSKVDNPRERYQHQVAQRAIEWEFAMQCTQRRLGQLRQRQHQDDLPVHPVRRSQRDARSADAWTSPDACWRCWPAYGYTRDDKRVEKAIKFIFSEQEPDGSWFGRWGVNYIYGTFLVLRGLEAIGVDHLEPQMQQAAEWIRMVQNPDGGWGETCGSYDDPEHARHRAQHALADRVGDARPARRRRRPLRLGRQGRALAARRGRRADGSWDESIGEGPTRQAHHHRHGISQGLLSGLHHVPPLFPAAGFDHLQAGHGTQLQPASIERSVAAGLSRLTISRDEIGALAAERAEAGATAPEVKQRWLFQSHRCGRSQPTY